MKRLMIPLVIAAAVLVAAIIILYPQRLPEQAQPQQQPQPQVLPEPPEGAVVFDMAYRGLSGEKDTLRHNANYGFGYDSEADSKFVRAVKEQIRSPHTVQIAYNPRFNRAKWSAVELDGSEALFFYFDLNSNEKLDENEKIQPLPRDDSSRENTYEFVTPDFLITTEDGRRIPFRTRLQTRFYTNREAVRCSWSPSCILEGTAQFGQQKKRLILFTGGFGPNFNTFGRSTYSLLNADADMKEHAGRQGLSSLINYEGVFYRVKLYGQHEQNSIVRVVLEKDITPTGELVVNLTMRERLDCELRRATITGADDKTIYLSIHGQTTLPHGKYKLDRGSFTLGKSDDTRWTIDFSQGPEMSVDATKTCTVELGEPKISITAVENNNRYSSDVKEMTEFKKGTKIYISPKVKGKAGELYGRIRRRDGGGSEYVKPEITIIGPDNTQIVSKQLEYG